MNLILDTETSGLFTRNKTVSDILYKNLDCFKNCRIVSICWLVAQHDEIINQSYYIIKPDKFIISKESFAIHGISQEEANTTGIIFTNILFISYIVKVSQIKKFL